MLMVRHDLPPDFMSCDARDLHHILRGPTLVHLPGTVEPPLFVSLLLHGNEVTGLLAVQELLRRQAGRPLPRALSLFVGNVAAARHGLRYLPGQPDYNRIWCSGRDQEHDMTREVLDRMQERGVFAGIDIHNNTGRNPRYTIIAQRTPTHLALARRFSDIVVYATCPDTTCTYAFAQIAPAVTVEAGMSGEDDGTRHVADYLQDCLRLDGIEAEEPGEHLALFHTVAVVKVPRDCSFGFQEADVDLRLDPTIDRYNFRELEAGTCLARLRPGAEAVCLDVRASDGRRHAGEFFAVHGEELRLARPLMPAMLTTDEDIIRMDCLCYLMERMQVPQ
jgi:succinylglutamate desuccinylase